MASTVRALELGDFPAYCNLDIPFGQLGRFVHLTYLGLTMEWLPQDDAAILAAIAAMPNLRALAVAHASETFLFSLPTRCPLLRHFSVGCDEADVEEMGRAAAAFTGLLSLYITLDIHDPTDGGELDWLRATIQRGKLEYFRLDAGGYDYGVPAKFVAELVSKCKVGCMGDMQTARDNDRVIL